MFIIILDQIDYNLWTEVIKLQHFEIKEVKAREILDCRGEPTIEVDVRTKEGFLGRACMHVGLNAGQIKTGVTRSERTAKYNQLFRIEEELGSKAKYAGRNFRQPF